MADFSTATDTDNNPEDWFTSDYNYDDANKLITIDLTAALTQTGVTEPDLNETTGDVRSVYLAVAEALFQAYDGKDASASTTSARLRMTKSQAIHDAAPVNDLNADGVEEDIRYTTYTIHVQEHGEALKASAFVTKGVKPE